MLTSRGFDQENSAPDSANETQSTGVPDSQNKKFITNLLLTNDHNQNDSMNHKHTILQACTNRLSNKSI